MGPGGLTVFFRSDYVACRRPGFYASVKLCSHRVIGGEANNFENISGRYLADGALFLYQTGKEYTDIFPVWDWWRVPGVTCVTTGTTIETEGRMDTDFAGGVSDGVYGAAGLEYWRDGVRGKKGWFFFDEGIICLGVGITGTAGGVRTSIDQRLAESVPESSQGPLPLEPKLCKGLRWVLEGGLGYLFPEPRDAWAGTQQQRGNWKNVYASGSGTEIRKDVFSIWLGHPAESSSYAYMLVPEATARKLQGYVTHSPIDILSNTPGLQAARANASGITGILFYEAGKLDAGALCIAADRPCAVVLRRESLYVADPTQKERQVTLTINGNALPVKLPAGEMAGSSVLVGTVLR
jgi:chondroitin AC lyase